MRGAVAGPISRNIRRFFRVDVRTILFGLLFCGSCGHGVLVNVLLNGACVLGVVSSVVRVPAGCRTVEAARAPER